MKIQAIVLASALACCGTAFAAAPDDASKASSTDTAASTDKAQVKHAVKKHKVVHHAKKHAQHMGAAAAPQTDVNDNSRQARMDEALAKFRQQRS